jgi:hypothetical protein
MEKIKPAEGENPLAAFCGDELVTPDDYTLLDRSTLEQWANCPAQAALVASGHVNTSSDIANAGEEVHKAFASVIEEWTEQDSQCTQRHLRDWCEGALLNCRPDVQPEAIRAARASVYAWAEFLRGSFGEGGERGVAHENILRYDGGTGAKSGQLAFDIPALNCRPTSELDILISVHHTEELLWEIDWKTGNKMHTADMVRDSFQFQMHAVLVFRNYDDVNGLRVQCWNTRKNRRTFTVEFRREDLPKYEARVKRAAAIWYEYHTLPPEMCPTWPSQEKCRLCDAAHECPASGTVPVVGEWAADMLRSFIALSEKTKRVKDWLTDYVDRHGDITLDSGECFGRVATTKPVAKLYKEKE